MKKIMLILSCIAYTISCYAITQVHACSIGEKYACDTISEIMVTNNLYNAGDSIKIEGDYIICPFDSAWCVFIDFHPLTEWMHDCAYLFIGANNGDTISYIKHTPPASISELWSKHRIYRLPISVQTQHKSLLLERLEQGETTNLIKRHQATRTNNSSIAEITYPNTYAIIINCAYSAEYNYERYWNDCAGIYNTFRNYGLPKENIFTAFGYGNNSSIPDVRLNSGELIISPKDFDGDGLNDVRYPATIDGIIQLFRELSESIQENDIVNIYINGHADIATGLNYDYCHGNYCSSLFDSGHLHDSELGSYISRLGCLVVNVFLEREFSSNLSACIINNIEHQQNYVITGKIRDQDTYVYDEFTYNIISALNMMTPDNVAVTSDLNNDGKVSMREVYDYLTSQATPVSTFFQECTPFCLAFNLSLENLFEENTCLYSDLYIRDNTIDTGIEPNMTTNLSYTTPDIWAEDMDGNVVDVLNSGETYFICARITNRGSIPTPGDEILYLHWTKAVIGGKWPDSWIEGALHECNGVSVSVGGEITPVGGFILPSIDAHDTYIARVLWTTPDNSIYTPCSEFIGNDNELWHYCLLARIYDEHENPGEDLMPISMHDFVLHSNNVASRNITIMSLSNNVFSGVVGITAPYSGLFTLRGYSLNYPELHISYGDVSLQLTLSDNLLNSWSQTGSEFSFFDYNYLDILSDTVYLYELYLNEDEMYSLKLDMTTVPIGYMYNIELIDQNGFPVGGEIFHLINDNFQQNFTPRWKKQIDTESMNNLTSIDCIFEQETNNIQIKTQENVLHITLLDYAGNTIMRQIDTNTIDVSTVPTGIYIVIVETDSLVQQFKIIKK